MVMKAAIRISSKFLLGTFLASAHIGYANASTNELQKSIFQAIPWDESSPSLEQRSKMAHAVLAYWTDFSSRVPRPSPAEIEWVETEVTMQGERLRRAVNSPEYAIYRLSKHADNCIRDVAVVIDDQSNPAFHQFEMLHWVHVANCYSETDVVNYLVAAGLMNDPYDDAFATAGRGLILGRLLNVVIPTTMAETMGWRR